MHVASEVKLTQKHLSVFILASRGQLHWLKKNKTKLFPQELWSQSLFEVVWRRRVQSGTQCLLPAPPQQVPLIQTWLLWLVQRNKMATVKKNSELVPSKW